MLPLSQVIVSAPNPRNNRNRSASGERDSRGHQDESSFSRAADRVCALYKIRTSGSDSIRHTISDSASDDLPDCRGTLTITSR